MILTEPSGRRVGHFFNIWVIPREVTQENTRPPSILMKIDKPIVPHDRNMYAQF